MWTYHFSPPIGRQVGNAHCIKKLRPILGVQVNTKIDKLPPNLLRTTWATRKGNTSGFHDSYSLIAVNYMGFHNGQTKSSVLNKASGLGLWWYPNKRILVTTEHGHQPAWYHTIWDVLFTSWSLVGMYGRKSAKNFVYQLLAFDRVK